MTSKTRSTTSPETGNAMLAPMMPSPMKPTFMAKVLPAGNLGTARRPFARLPGDRLLDYPATVCLTTRPGGA